jgi:D-amino-acid oxidase
VKPSRRQILRAVGAGVGASLLRSAFAEVPMKNKLARVEVSRDRILRRIVGLRPFRPSGFVVRADKLSDKLLVHNYGHGGAGVTLSWGTAKLAVDLMTGSEGKEVAVLGGGAVGFATARLLQERGKHVTIYTRELSPNTTSDVAGARFYPFDVFDHKVVTPAFLASLWSAARYAYGVFKALPAEYGVYYYPTYCCRNTAFPPESLLHFDSPVHDLLPGLRDVPRAESVFPYPIVRTWQTMMIEPAIYLPAIRKAFEQAGGKIVVRGFSTKEEIAALSEKTVFNCTGLSSGTLFGDTELYPIKGQLTILHPQPEVQWVALPPDLYMFPRKDGIVLGGTFQHRVSSMDLDTAAEDRILANHAKFYASMKI